MWPGPVVSQSVGSIPLAVETATGFAAEEAESVAAPAVVSFREHAAKQQKVKATNDDAGAKINRKLKPQRLVRVRDLRCVEFWAFIGSIAIHNGFEATKRS